MMLHNEPETWVDILWLQKIMRKLMNAKSAILLSVTIVILILSIMVDYLFFIFAGPIGSALAVPFLLVIAVISLLIRRNLSAFLTSGAIVLCCALSMMITTQIFSKLGATYFKMVKTVLLYWYYWITLDV